MANFILAGITITLSLVLRNVIAQFPDSTPDLYSLPDNASVPNFGPIVTGFRPSLAQNPGSTPVIVASNSPDSTPNNYVLPEIWDIIERFGPINTGFSCEGLPYGYYADTGNGCRVFHVCYSFMDVNNNIRTRMFSLICGLGAVFNQQSLVCDHPQNSIACDDSPNWFSRNDYFGRTDVNFLE